MGRREHRASPRHRGAREGINGRSSSTRQLGRDSTARLRLGVDLVTQRGGGGKRFGSGRRRRKAAAALDLGFGCCRSCGRVGATGNTLDAHGGTPVAERPILPVPELRISRGREHLDRRHADSRIGTMRTPRSPSRTAVSAPWGQPDRRHADTRIGAADSRTAGTWTPTSAVRTARSPREDVASGWFR